MVWYGMHGDGMLGKQGRKERVADGGDRRLVILWYLLRGPFARPFRFGTACVHACVGAFAAVRYRWFFMGIVGGGRGSLCVDKVPLLAVVIFGY